MCLEDPVDGAKMKVKVLHQAGGTVAAELNKEAGGFRKWMSSVVSPEVNDYLNEITHG